MNGHIKFYRKIRPCPSINPGCISTNPQSSALAFPWTIPENSVDDAIQVGSISSYMGKLFKLESVEYDVCMHCDSYCRNCRMQSLEHRRMPRFRLWKILHMVITLKKSTMKIIS